ncbi:Regulator of nonsense transcripts 1 [Thelohanellus kitauei]|uniref:Regulator of nonsense transcripts 1 n=1 Tax=Thelohanellus kitauei TaxID=669202 RepID=A0A0C2MYG0_THEKT|nr:Regulator of nonsense transcripts 1 [Thelohanellus kitauei]
MVGDHRQLGPVVKCKSASEKGLSISLFDRLIKIGSIPYRLNEQYRMHPALSEFSSLAFYDGTVKSGVTIADRTDKNISFKWPLKDKPSFFYCCYGIEQPSSSGTSFFNQQEVEAVNIFVTKLIDAGVKGSQIGIITPYDGQRSSIADLFVQRNCNKFGWNPYSEGKRII